MSSPPDLGANEEDNLDELNRVFELLQRLDSRDPDELHEAEQEIDEFLRRRKGKECVVTHSRTVIAAGPADKAKKLRNEGNDCFNRGEFARARELYTSAILEDGGCHIAYTNRAQANIRLADFAAAIEDCRMAIKIRPDSVKAQVHLAKALKGSGQLQKALEVLDIAEDTAARIDDNKAEAVVKTYKNEFIKAAKEELLEKVKK